MYNQEMGQKILRKQQYLEQRDLQKNLNFL